PKQQDEKPEVRSIGIGGDGNGNTGERAPPLGAATPRVFQAATRTLVTRQAEGSRWAEPGQTKKGSLTPGRGNFSGPLKNRRNPAILRGSRRVATGGAPDHKVQP